MGLPMLFAIIGIALLIWIAAAIIKKNPKFMSIWPQSRSGKWSVGLVILSLIVMILVMITINTAYLERGTLPAIILGTSWTIMTVIATIVCIKAFWKDQERAIIFLLCAFIVLLMFIVALIEIIEGIRMLLGLPIG